MKKRSLKQQLLLSVTALLLCVSMFVGSTFAWFTDSVTSTNNIIKSGNLDVSLEWLEGDEDPTSATAAWMDASKSEPIFNSKLWEPGYTAVRHIKIENEGSLALKYVLTITAYDGTTPVAPENVSKLADVIDVYYADPAQSVTRDTVETLHKLGSLREVLAGLESTANGTLKEKGASDVITLALKMREDANNDYQDLSIGDNFSITLFATQLEHEDDSFDENYDKDSVYAEHFVTNADELTAAIAEGGVIALMNDLELEDNTNIIIPKGVATTINLNGNDIVGTSAKASGNQVTFTVKGDLTVEGTGTVSHVHTGANMGWGNLTAPFSVEGGTLTLGEGVNVINKGGSNMAYAVDVNTTLGASTLNVNGATLYSTYTGVRIFNNHQTAKGIVNFNDGYIEGPRRDIWAQAPSASTVADNAIVNIANGFAYNKEVESDGIGLNYFFTDYSVATDDEVLDKAIKDGATTVVLPSGNYVIPDSASGKNLTIVGNGDTVIESQDDGAQEGDCDYSFRGSTVTFENVTITTSTTYFPGYAGMKGIYNNCTINGVYALYDDSEFNNCTFNIEGDLYNVWTWGATKATFNNCTFNSDGKAILLYGTVDTTLTVNGCTFNDNGGLTDLKAAIEIGNDYNKSYNLIVNNTVVNGYEINDKGINTGTTLWGNKNSMGTDKLNVVVDGVDVY